MTVSANGGASMQLILQAVAKQANISYRAC